MKRFLKKNIKISILCFVSLVIVISYAITYNMPDYFNIEGWYSLLNNISISYIAAFIFYIFQVYIPESNKSRRAYKNLKPLFLDLIKFIDINIACWREYINFDENGRISIDWWDKELKVIYFVVMIDNQESHELAEKRTASELKNMDNMYKSKIKEIKEKVDLKECDDDLLDAFSKLEFETTKFFKHVHLAVLIEHSFIDFSTLQNSVDDFEKKKDYFKRSLDITCKYGIRKANIDDIAFCEAVHNKQSLLATSGDKLIENLIKEFSKFGSVKMDNNEIGDIKAFATEDKRLDKNE